MKSAPRSIRRYLLTRLLGGAALVLVAAGLIVYLSLARALEGQFDANLRNRVQGFASILFQVGDEVSFEFSEQLMPEYENADAPAYFQLHYADGELLERSETLAGQDLAVPEAPTATPVHWTAPLPDGRSGRFVSQVLEIHHVYPEEGPDRPQAKVVAVVIADGREGLVAAERGVMIKCLLVCVVMMLMIGALTWRSVNRGLEPANRLAAAVDAIHVEQLPERLDVGELPPELVPVATKTDALIHRVAAALERERRTTADIAHELRTPITEVLTVSEVALRDRRDFVGARKALGCVRDVASRMGRSVSTLLKLARLDMGSERFDREDVALGAVVTESLGSLAALERDGELDVRNLTGSNDVVVGDRDVLRIVVSNLLGNALFYSPRGGRVECRLERSQERARGRWRFVVENEAPGLRAADLGTLVQPFWRKDDARVDREHSGLGLALSRALAEKTGNGLDFELEAGVFRAILSGEEPDDGARVHAPDAERARSSAQARTKKLA